MRNIYLYNVAMSQRNSHRILENIEDLIVAGEYAYAKKYLLKVIQKDINNPEAHYLLGDVYCKLGEFILAIEEEEIANNLFPNNPKIIHLLGWAHFMNGNIATGRKYMESVLLVNPDDAYLLCDLAVLEMRAGNEKALEYVEKARTISPNDSLIQETYFVANKFFQSYKERKKNSN
jgi:Flp pilus assembly protein TadD